MTLQDWPRNGHNYYDDGQAQVERDFYAQSTKEAQKALEIDETVDGMSAGDIDGRLREFRRK